MLDGEELEHLSKFNVLGYKLHEKGKNDAECGRKVMNGRKRAGVIKSLVNGRE